VSEAIAVREVGLLRVEEARNMLALCKTVDEARDIRDKAAAIAAYMRTQKAGTEAQNDAAEIKLRAERRLGQLLAEQEKHKGGRPSKTDDTMSSVPTLREQGIEPKQSERWQAVASVPEEDFEAHLSTVRRNNERITTAALIEDVRRAEKLEEIAKVRTPALATIPDCPVVLADPPWRYEHSKTDSRQIENSTRRWSLRRFAHSARLPRHPRSCSSGRRVPSSRKQCSCSASGALSIGVARSG
jgi:hypothetical protein